MPVILVLWKLGRQDYQFSLPQRERPCLKTNIKQSNNSNKYTHTHINIANQ